MFALAVWDREEQHLSLARDRLGIKPLYFGWIGARFVFSSELKALTCLKDFTREVDREALASFFHYGCVPAPQCIYKGIEVLQTGDACLHLNRAECARRTSRGHVAIGRWSRLSEVGGRSLPRMQRPSSKTCYGIRSV